MRTQVRGRAYTASAMKLPAKGSNLQLHSLLPGWSIFDCHRPAGLCGCPPKWQPITDRPTHPPSSKSVRDQAVPLTRPSPGTTPLGM